MSNKIFDWKEYKNNKKIAVHCDTRLKAIDFAVRMINETLEPKDRPPLKAFEEFVGVTWSMSHEDYCIASNGTHSRKDFYKEKGYTIFEYDDYFEVKQETIDRNTTPLI